MRCAVVDHSTSLVVNVIVADPVLDIVPEGLSLIPVDEEEPLGIGWEWDGQSFVNPQPE
jgi:hypothetical protein